MGIYNDVYINIFTIILLRTGRLHGENTWKQIRYIWVIEMQMIDGNLIL